MTCRNGCFLLQSSQNILEPPVLLDCEEALNQGSMTAAEVFMSLRSKSILHLFASIGRFLGLEVNIFSLCFPFKVKWHWSLDW